MSTELALIDEITEDKYPVIYGKGGLDQFCVRTKINGFMMQNCRFEGCNDVEIRQVPTRGDQ